jgi:hypothetical protein
MAALAACALVAQPAWSGVVSWHEDMETTSCGALPAGWTDGGGNNEMGTVWDVGSVVCHGNHSLGFFGVVGGCWAALAVHGVSPDDLAYATSLTLEFVIRGGKEPTSGCHGGARAHVELNAAPDWTGAHRGLFYLGGNGELFGSGLDLGTIPLEECHRIRIEYVRVDESNVHIAYALDGTAVGETTLPASGVEDSFVYLHFGALEGSAWYDDIDVVATTGAVSLDQESWGRVKGYYHR